MVQDRIVCGIQNQNVREKLLAEGDELTLDKATFMCRSHEAIQAQLKKFNRTRPAPIKQEIDAIFRYQNWNSGRNKQTEASSSKSKACYFCGRTYSPSHICPAKGKTCSICKKTNHFDKVCQSKTVSAVDEDTADTNPCDKTVFLYSIEQSKNKDEAVIPQTINNQFPVQFKIGTGAQVNVIPKKYFDLITPKPTMKLPYSVI
ncbi:uncharacterized protein LOC136042715 [Artemia franciscana]|uniref:uncharacterized protein LOC136042715 n=1 Tax=Artemia franciscana TaxID=6661 RepID=UPI0032DB0A4C